MTRRVSILVYSLAIGLVLLGLQSWGVAVGLVERHVVSRIEDRTGLKVTGLERANIVLLPLPRIELSQVSFRQHDGLLSGKASQLKARARLLPLLIGRLSFDRIDLVSPEIDATVAGRNDELSEWLATPLAYLSGLTNQSRIVIISGSVFARAEGAIRTILRDVNLVIEDRDPEEPIIASGSVTWRGVATNLSVVWPVAGERARLSLSATSERVNLRLDGIRSGLREPVFNGQLSLSTRSLPDLFGWFGETPRLAAAIGQLSLAAEAQIKANEISLSSASAIFDGDRLDGAIMLGEAGQRWFLSGTLAGATLDLGRMTSRLGLPKPGTGLANPTPLEFEAWTAHDIDLRVSVDAARLGGARLSDVATQLLVKKGRFEAGLLRATAYDGSVKGRLLASAAPNAIDVKLQGNLDRINLGQSAADLPELPKLNGQGNLQFALDGTGTTAEAVLASLNGRASLSLRHGELGGFAFTDLLRRAERNPLAALREWRQGKTAFDNASATANVADGIATIADAQMTGPTYRLTLAGQAFLQQGWIEMAGQLAQQSGSLTVPLVLQGPLEGPSLALDSEATLRPAGSSLPNLLTR